MKVYKLFRKRKDGTLGPLFIGARKRLPLGVRLKAELIPTKGFKVREGWHACLQPYAPHLKQGLGSGRVWCLCEAEGLKLYSRPLAQGGTWVTAEHLTIIKEL